MIHKIIKGSYFKGALRYVLDPEKGFLIGGTFGSHQSPAQIAHEMLEVSGDRLRKPVFHAVLSLRPGESLSDDQWNDAARKYLSALGYNDTPFVLVRHTNRAHDHVHIVASRVRFDGTVVSDRQDRFKGLATVRNISRELGLSAGGPPSPRSLVAAELRALIKQAAQGEPSFSAFVSRLEASGVRVITHVASNTQKVQGLSFLLDGMTFKGSHLDRQFSWHGIREKLGVRYNAATDLPVVLAHAARREPGKDADMVESAWSQATIKDLASRLRSLRGHHKAGAAASRDLRQLGAKAFRLSAHIARFLEGRESAVNAGKALTSNQYLSLALSFLGAFRSPGSTALFLLRLAGRAARTSGSGDPGSLFLRQLVLAASGDRPSFDVFAQRLAEAGVHLKPGFFVLPDRVVSSRTLGLDAAFLERLGVQDAGQRFRSSDRPIRFGDRDRGNDGADPSDGYAPSRSDLGPNRGARAQGSGGRAAGSVGDSLASPDGGADFGRGAPPQQPQTTRTPNLAHRLDSRPLDHPRDPAWYNGSSASLVPDRATRGPAPDRTPPQGKPSPPASGSTTGSLLDPSGSYVVPSELALQYRALGDAGVEIRTRTPSRTLTHRLRSEAELAQALPSLAEQARLGASFEIRSLDPRAQVLSGVTPAQLERARRQGVEPSAVLQRADGTLDVWLLHSPAASPETLGYLKRTLRAEYGQEPLGASKSFGAVSGLDSSVRLLEAPGLSYTRADSLADCFAVSQRALDERLAARFRAQGIPRLAEYRTLNPGTRAELDWARFALKQGIDSQDVALELVRYGSRAKAGPRSRALYASRVLARALPAPGSQSLPQLLTAGSKLLGVPAQVLSVARFVLDRAVRLTLGRP